MFHLLKLTWLSLRLCIQMLIHFSDICNNILGTDVKDSANNDMSWLIKKSIILTSSKKLMYGKGKKNFS